MIGKIKKRTVTTPCSMITASQFMLLKSFFLNALPIWFCESLG